MQIIFCSTFVLFAVLALSCGDSNHSGDEITNEQDTKNEKRCGDNYCDVTIEDCLTCPGDCSTRELVCGNGECQNGENHDNCSTDCGPSSWPEAWAALENEVLELVNQHRAAGTSCPSGNKSSASSLQVDAAIRDAARFHSWEQASLGFMDHMSCNGRTPFERAQAEGAVISAENVAAGFPTADSVVAGWMQSNVGHCDAIMESSFGHVGIGYAVEEFSAWTMKFR